MKSKILTLLFVLGCCSFAFSQANDGICAPTTTVDPVVVTDPTPPDPIVACSDGTGAPTFATPSGSLPDTDYVVEVNGAIDVINQTGAPDAALADGDVVCVTAINYDLATIDGILNSANGICPIIDCDNAFGLPGLTQTIADLVNGVNDGMPGLNSLDEALALAASFGTPINSVADAIVALDGVNGAIAGFFPPGICYATSAPVCYTIDDSAAACDTGGSACTVDAGEPTPATADVCDTDLAAVDVTAVFADPGVPGTPSLNQNYVIVDPTNGNDIITVSNTAILDLTGLMVGDQACVVSVAYTQETLDIVTAFVDAQLGSICVPVVGPCASDFIGPFGTLDLSGFLNGLNGAFETFGFDFTSDDIALWCINQEITLPLSAIPGGLFSDLVIDLTTIPGLEPDGFCCDFSTDTHCLTVISCGPVCQGIDLAAGLPVIPTEVCSGATADICLTLVDAAEGLVITGTIDGAPVTLTGTPGAGTNELCVSITAPANETCAPVDVVVQIDAIQCTDGTDYPGVLGGATLLDDLNAAGVNPIAIPVYPTLSVNTTGDGMCSSLVAELVAADGMVCATAAGSPVDCADTDGTTLNYDFTGDPALADFIAVPADCPLPTLSGTLTCAGCTTMGCTDPCAPNYDPDAGVDDGSCMPYDMTCNTDCTAGPFGGVWDPVACACTGETTPVTGCTDPDADNYNAAANCDDGSCMTTTACNISVSISNYACDDGGTPDNPADDMVTFNYTVMDISGTGTTWSSDQGDAGAAYGTTVMVGPVLADGTTWTINVTDDGDATCTASASQVLSDCAPVENIPTVGEWGLIILGLLMSITAIVGIRQRREEEAYS